MLINPIKNLLIKFMVTPKTLIRYSALFVNGPKATNTYVYVFPHIDFPECIKQKDKLQEYIQRRNSNFDLNKLERLWAVYEELKQRKLDLDKKKVEISKHLMECLQSDPNDSDVNKLRIQLQLVKENLKKLKPPLWSAEEIAILEALKLPNMLHPKTPDGESEVLYNHLSPPTNNKNHLHVGKEQNLLQFKKNENYYLMGDAAVFELGAKFYVSSCLKKANYVQFSNPDFVKSVIIEGCGEDHTDPDSTYILHHNEDSKVNINSRLHLTGGSSLYSFFAYHSKNIVYGKTLPLKYFSMGRQYLPSKSDENSLFHVSQSSVIQLFGVAKDENEQEVILEELINILKNIYTSLGYHFRLTVLSADKLFMSERLRISVEMYSTSLSSYIEVAFVASSGDFISKRLMFTYIDIQKNSNFPYIIHGTAVNVPKLLGCVLEQDSEFIIPECFNIHNWSM